MNPYPILYRKRLIPNECILLKDDVILSCGEDIILTKWNTLKPKNDLHHGFSCYLLKDHLKISKFCRADGSFLFWYCDIVDYAADTAVGTLTSIDLCVDVVVHPDGRVRVLDLDELAQARREKLLDDDLLDLALCTTNTLLQRIYHGAFGAYTDLIENVSSYGDAR